MTAQDRAYYLSRAEAELALAQCATHPAAMRAHYHLAGFYLDTVYGPRSSSPGRPQFSAAASFPSAASPVLAA